MPNEACHNYEDTKVSGRCDHCEWSVEDHCPENREASTPRCTCMMSDKPGCDLYEHELVMYAREVSKNA